MSFLDKLRKIEGYSNITEEQFRQMEPSKKIELIRKVSEEDEEPNINEADYGQEQDPGNRQESNGKDDDVNIVNKGNTVVNVDKNGNTTVTINNGEVSKKAVDETKNGKTKINNTKYDDFLKDAFGEENIDKHKKVL